MTRRYQVFTEMVPQLIGRGLSFVEIGSNDEIWSPCCRGARPVRRRAQAFAYRSRQPVTRRFGADRRRAPATQVRGPRSSGAKLEHISTTDAGTVADGYTRTMIGIGHGRAIFASNCAAIEAITAFGGKRRERRWSSLLWLPFVMGCDCGNMCGTFADAAAWSTVAECEDLRRRRLRPLSIVTGVCHTTPHRPSRGCVGCRLVKPLRPVASAPEFSSLASALALSFLPLLRIRL